MKTRAFIFYFFLCLNVTLKADYVRFMPFEITQPDKTVVHCFVTGDEYNRTVHDKDGYTIVQSDVDGYYYYAEKIDQKLVPSKYKVGVPLPSKAGIEPWLKVINVPRDAPIDDEQDSGMQRIRSAKAPSFAKGTITNIVIYVRFKGEPEFSKSRKEFNKTFESTGNSKSLNNYFQEISYNQLSIKSEQFPVCDSSLNLSYEDIHFRSFYQPYNAVTNTNGYQPDSEDREQPLVKRAIDAVSSQIPTNLIVDANGDNYVDNVTIVIKGGVDGWGKLLWPHKWWLYKQTAYIHGKRVGNYVFIPESMLTVRTMCHEMFHVVGAPDLYHYTNNGITPAGFWDIMQNGEGHPLAYMKWKYSGQKWITNIPEITKSGEYSIKALSNPTNNCYKIKSPYSSTEYFVVEYRRKTGLYESTLPQSGLIITRINLLASGYGNAGGPPDEVHVMRPNGSIFSDGLVSSAALGDINSRPVFNFHSNPSAVLSNQTEAGVSISDIRIKGDSATFKVDFIQPIINKRNWMVTANSYETTGNYSPTKIIDDNIATIWHTNWSTNAASYPHWIKIDMKEFINVKGIKYQPRTDMSNGRIKDFEVYVSADENEWEMVASGSFSNNSSEQTVSFPEHYCRYVKLVALNEVNGQNFASMSEFNIQFNNSLLPQKKWKIVSASSFDVGYEPSLAIDGSASTMWHTKYTHPEATYPHEIVVDMNDTCSVDGLFYLPRQDAVNYGTIANYEFHTSLDGVHWTLVDTGKWKADRSAKSSFFAKSVCRYLKLIAKSEINLTNHASISELAVYGTFTNDVVAPIAPLNFRVDSRINSTINIKWDKDIADKSILYYQLSTADDKFNKIYTNEYSTVIDTLKTYTFTLHAIDGSGNMSPANTLTYNAATGFVSTMFNTPKLSSFDKRITVENLDYNSQILIYNSMGQLLLVKQCNSSFVQLEHNYVGLGFVEIRKDNVKIFSQKIIF